jgi:hypothetical protein
LRQRVAQELQVFRDLDRVQQLDIAFFLGQFQKLRFIHEHRNLFHQFNAFWTELRLLLDTQGDDIVEIV